MGTAFTYQGRLEDGGNPADGEYDFEFKLYDAASDGNPVGSPSTMTADDMTVTDGYFTVELDFGGSAFTGDARWLERGNHFSRGSFIPNRTAKNCCQKMGKML